MDTYKISLITFVALMADIDMHCARMYTFLYRISIFLYLLPCNIQDHFNSCILSYLLFLSTHPPSHCGVAASLPTRIVTNLSCFHLSVYDTYCIATICATVL